MYIVRAARNSNRKCYYAIFDLLKELLDARRYAKFVEYNVYPIVFYAVHNERSPIIKGELIGLITINKFPRESKLGKEFVHRTPRKSRPIYYLSALCFMEQDTKEVYTGILSHCLDMLKDAYIIIESGNEELEAGLYSMGFEVDRYDGDTNHIGLVYVTK